MSKAKKEGLQRASRCAIVLSNAVAIQFTPVSVVDTEEGRESGYDGKSSLQQVTAAELFEAFRRENKTLHSRVSESLQDLRLAGWIEPYTILLKGPSEDLELIKETWKRHLLRSPSKFIIRDIGDITSLGMEVIQQAPFMPLTKALHEAIKKINESHEAATQESIWKFLRQNYQDVHIPSMDIIHNCLGLLIKERMVYHNGNGYFINKSTTKSTESSTPTDSSGNKEKELDITTRKKAVKEITSSSKKDNHEKEKPTSSKNSDKQTKNSTNTDEKSFDRKLKRDTEQLTISSNSRRQQETESQRRSNDSKTHDLLLRSFSSNKAEEETKRQIDINSDRTENTGSPSDEGRIKRGFLERMSGRKPKADKEKLSQEDSKGSKEKKSVLNQIACLIKNRSLASSSSSGSTSSTMNSTNTVQPLANEKKRELLSQSPACKVRNDFSAKEESSPRNFSGQTQQDLRVRGKQNREETDEIATLAFTRSQSFVTPSRKRRTEITRSNSFTSSRPSQVAKRVTATANSFTSSSSSQAAERVTTTSNSFTSSRPSQTAERVTATTNSFTSSRPSQAAERVTTTTNSFTSSRPSQAAERVTATTNSFTSSRPSQAAERVTATTNSFTSSRLSQAAERVVTSNSFTSSRPSQTKERVTTTKVNNENATLSAIPKCVSVANKGPCAVGIVRPLSHHLGSQNGPSPRQRQSPSSSRRSSSFNEKVRPRSAPFAVDLCGDMRNKPLRGGRGMGRDKSFGNTQKERNIFAEKTPFVLDGNFHRRIVPPQNYNAPSNSRTSSHGPRVRTLAVPIKSKYGHLQNTSPKKIYPRTSARRKTCPAVIDSSVSVKSKIGHVHYNDNYCTSPICNDKCKINEMKPIHCKCNEYEAEFVSEKSSESNHVCDVFERALQRDVSYLAEGVESIDVCLDEVSSTSESIFPTELRPENKQQVYNLNRPAAGQSDQTQHSTSCQIAPEEAKINSSLTFIGII